MPAPPDGAESPLRAPLPRAFYARPAFVVAPELLGMTLLGETDDAMTGGIIVETEAYGGPEDRASHARAGPTRRTAPMFGPPGHAYVYLIYGMHWCLNVVTETDGAAGAVLIRAVLPTLGVDVMRARRGRPNERDERLGAGPARLAQALGVDGTQNGIDLTAGRGLWISDADPRGDAVAVVAGSRIGVESAGAEATERAWRFGIAGSPAVSRPFRAPRVR